MNDKNFEIYISAVAKIVKQKDNLDFNKLQ